MIILKTSATISDDFANVIKSGKYEEIIYELMCRSEVVFPSKYQYNQEQAHNLIGVLISCLIAVLVLIEPFIIHKTKKRKLHSRSYWYDHIQPPEKMGLK